MNGAELLMKALESEKVSHVFGYPGGAIMPVYDALLGTDIRHILSRHEQGAILAADAYARTSGEVAVCFGTSGPGATNLVTGLANAKLDSVPLVVVTGQVATNLIGTDAFQEVDVLGMTLSVVKHSFLVRYARDIYQTVKEAFRFARSGRPGPVLIDLPKDVAAKSVAEFSFMESVSGQTKVSVEDSTSIQEASDLIQASERPLVYAGGGIRIGRAKKVFQTFVEKHRIPVVATLQGIASIPGRHPLFLGMMGMHGSKSANLSIQKADLLIVIGARFDDRATGKVKAFAPQAKIIHLDVDPAEISKIRDVDMPLIGQIKDILPKLITEKTFEPWLQECQNLVRKHSIDYESPGAGIYAPRLLHNLSRQAESKTIITCDVGQHQMWVAQHFQFTYGQYHLTSGGLGAMGYGLPAAVGAQISKPDYRVINVAGDGSIMMNIQELATVHRYQLPIKILLLDNACLGMVRQWQELFFNERFSEIDLSDNPDFVKIARAFGLKSFLVEKKEDEQKAINHLLNDSGPLLIHVKINPRENVWPLVPPNESIHHMLEKDRPCSIG